jgi:fibronectin type 3 domain-containing protein
MTWFRQLLSAGFALALSAALSGCASVGAPLPPSLELPKPPSDLRAFRKGDRVTLTWTVPERTIDRQTVRHRGVTLICRNLQVTMSDCGAPVGTVAPETIPTPAKPGGKGKDEQSFIDVLSAELQEQSPTKTITYAVEPLNDSNRGAGLSNQVQVPLAPTIAPPDQLHAQLTSDGVVLTWQGELLSLPMSPINYFYRVYRRSQGTQERTVIGQVTRGMELHPTVVDHAFAWEKTYEYWITVVTSVTTGSHPCPNGEPLVPCLDHIEVEGADSPAVTVITHDVFPPAIPSGLQAVFSGPGQTPYIDLIWAPDTDADLAGYHVYRRETSGAPVKIKLELVKTPAYRDANVASGKTYWYSVSAVDLHGNESARSDETSETVP